MVEPNKDADTSGIGISDLNEQLKSLGQYLKSATFTAKSKFSKPNRDPRNQSQGPGPSVAGPFQDHPPYSATNVAVGDTIRGSALTRRR